jgi:hypothetical protein
MPGIVLTFPIVTSRVEAWRRFCQEMSGSRRQMYEDSRRRLGVTRERLALVESAYGSTAVTILEARDVGQALWLIITSTFPFDCWYREQMQELFGVNLAGYEQFAQPGSPPPNHELLFEWTHDAGPELKVTRDETSLEKRRTTP